MFALSLSAVMLLALGVAIRGSSRMHREEQAKRQVVVEPDWMLADELSCVPHGIAQRIVEIVLEEVQVDLRRARLDAYLVEDLGIGKHDCLEIAECAMRLEEEFGFRATDADWGRVATVGDLVKFVHYHQNAQTAASGDGLSSVSVRRSPVD